MKKFLAALLTCSLVAIGVLSNSSESVQERGCGRPVITPSGEGRIIGGFEAIPNSWPWQVAMCHGGMDQGLDCDLACGATIIHNEYLLTAAICVVDFEPSEVRFKYGYHELDNTEEGIGQGIVEAESFHIHPYYTSSAYDILYDIAIVKLKNPISFGEKTQPICLANTDDHLEHQTQMFVIGWGQIETSGEVSNDLLQVVLRHRSRANCDYVFATLGLRNHRTIICAGGLENFRSACIGDFGVPYFKQDPNDGRFYQYGIFSFYIGDYCYEVGRPNGFARVPELCDFVEEIVGESVCVTPPESEDDTVIVEEDNTLEEAEGYFNTPKKAQLHSLKKAKEI